MTDRPEKVAQIIVQSMQSDKRERFIGWPERLFVKINALVPGLVDNAVSKQVMLLEQPSTEDPLSRFDGVKQ